MEQEPCSTVLLWRYRPILLNGRPPLLQGREGVGGEHRRRITTEEKAKVVASVWGDEFIQFLAALTVMPRMILNNRMNCTKMI